MPNQRIAALADELLEGGHHVFGPGGTVGATVQLQDVETVPTEPPQAVGALATDGRGGDVLATTGARLLVDDQAELGGHHDLVPDRGRQLGQGAADDPFGVPGAVRARGVDEPDAVVDHRVQRGDAHVVVDLAPTGVATVEGPWSAEGPGADAEGRHDQGRSGRGGGWGRT